MDSLTLDIVCEFRSKAITTETAGLNAVGEPHEIFIPEKKFTYQPGFCITTRVFHYSQNSLLDRARLDSFLLETDL